MTYTQEDMKRAINEAREQGRIEVIKNFVQGSICAVLFFGALALAFVLFT